MKKKLFVILFILILLISISIIYLNNVILPIKIKSLVINCLQEITQKKVSLDSLKFHIFKGLVLKNLVIYDEKKTFASLKEGSCTFLILPIFKKQIIIPTLRFKSPVIFLERRQDGTFNIQDLFLKKARRQLAPPLQLARGFIISVYTVDVRGATVHFQDDTLPTIFTKDIENLNLSLYLSLPSAVKFNLRSDISTTPPLKITALGEYNILKQQLTGKADIQNFSPREFISYYQYLGITVPEGIIDGRINFNFKDGVVNAQISAQNKDLAISKDKITARLNSQVSADLRYSLTAKQLDYSGKVAIAKLDFVGLDFIDRITDISGEVEFNNSSISCERLNANILGIPVIAKFNLTDFKAPIVKLALTSEDFFLKSGFTFKDKLITLSQCNGRYLNSEFLLTGDIDTTNPANLETDIGGRLKIDLQDIKGLLKKFQKQLEQINPAGLTEVQFTLNGKINDIKSCTIAAKISSPSVSVYGLKSQEFLLNYSQVDGVADIPLMQLSFYDGTVEMSAKMNLNSPNLPYWITANMQGVRIEKLKLDTAAKEKDIAGTLSAGVKINGFSGDLSKLSGAGKINISEGKVWQLNLFKGLGALLFAKDFAQIIFHEGYCAFIIQDKYIFTDNLILKSKITDLSGPVKIGFDSSIDANLNVEVLDGGVPLSGTFKDITTAIIGEAGRVGVIKISGTLKEPKYKFQTAIVDIIKGLKDSIFGK